MSLKYAGKVVKLNTQPETVILSTYDFASNLISLISKAILNLFF